MSVSETVRDFVDETRESWDWPRASMDFWSRDAECAETMCCAKR